MKLTRILGAVAAASASVLAMTHLGANPVAPGRDLGVVITTPGAADTIALESDAGDLSALIRLTLDASAGATYVAALENGTALATKLDPAPGGSLLTIHQPGGGPGDKFDWPAGVPVRVRREPAGGAAVRVTDWQVFSRDDESDSRAKARRRRVWWWLSSILLVVSAASAALTASRDTAAKPTPHGARDCVEALIEEIQGDSPEQTTLIRIFLRKRVLERASYEEARDAMGAPAGKALAAIGKALHYFPDRLNQLIDDLLEIAVELQPQPPADETPRAEGPAGTS